MTLPRRRVAALVVFLLCTSVNVRAATGAEVLRVRADFWMPFNGHPAAEKPGYVVELLQEIFERAGTKVDYQTMPWADALKSVEAGSIDAVIGANKKEATKLATGTEPVGDPKFALFVRSDSPWRYTSLRSLTGVKLGAIEGYSYWDSLDGYLQKAQPPAVKFYRGETPLVEALADLSANQIDVVVESVAVFFWTTKSLGRKGADFRIAYLQEAEPIFVAFAPNERGRYHAVLFDRGIRELKKSGRFDAILSQYGLGK
jgi:polar amino acid transport system substrate-binding protein